MLAATTVASAATPEAIDSGWILAQLARPAPMSTAFVELRDSPLLKAPLRIGGEYRRPDDATLVREVRSPYAETTTIRAGQATIVRGTRSRSSRLRASRNSPGCRRASAHCSPATAPRWNSITASKPPARASTGP